MPFKSMNIPENIKETEMQDRPENTTREKMCKQLAGRIAAIENLHPQLTDAQNGRLSGQEEHITQRVALGIDEIDQALDPYHGKGIEFSGLHEIRSQTTLSFAAAAGFALVLGNHIERVRFQRSQDFRAFEAEQFNRTNPVLRPVEANSSLPLRPIFWIADRFCQIEAGDFYGPGLYPLGINPGRLIRVLPHNFEESIWTAGEISQANQIAFALMEVRGNPHKLDLAVTRRLLLRCQTSQVPFFILRQAGQAQSSAVSTRWLVEPALSQSSDEDLQQVTGSNNLIGMTTWNISLEKCRGGKTGDWTLEWNHHEQTFQIANPSKSNISSRYSPSQSVQQSTRRSTRQSAGQVIRYQALSGNITAKTGN